MSVAAATNFSVLKDFLKTFTGKVFVLCDENTYTFCYECFATQIDQSFPAIIIKPGEENKNIDSCELVWNKLLVAEAGRDTLLINLGGGVVSDIGGFVAATYKRGIKFINIPTSLLAMVDAASGGKTGINFKHLKNIIGIIQQPEMVIVHRPFLNTLPERHIINGFAEMLKHAILSSESDFDALMQGYSDRTFLYEAIILKSLSVKESIVAKDPYEKGYRKVLNFGHTIGHAIEFAAAENGINILHGEAVLVGMLAALKLSVLKLSFDAEKAEDIMNFILSVYTFPLWIKESSSNILKAVMQDKKNADKKIKMVLLKGIGEPVYDVDVSLQEIEKVLNEMY